MRDNRALLSRAFSHFTRAIFDPSSDLSLFIAPFISINVIAHYVSLCVNLRAIVTYVSNLVSGFVISCDKVLSRRNF